MLFEPGQKLAVLQLGFFIAEFETGQESVTHLHVETAQA